MSRININQIRVWANHGCWEEEAIIGGDYIVDVSLELDFAKAAQHDDLDQTADYVVVKEIVYREMAVRAKLIETVAHRILSSIKKELPIVEHAFVRVTKLNAPMGGQVESVSVEVEG
jgi:dihydroneopterin aldolase